MDGRIAAVVNPAAGGGRSAGRWRTVARRLSSRGVEPRVLFTARAGNATTLTRMLLSEGFTTIVAVGGDGTINEVANGFLNGFTVRTDARLAVVPAGTGMDFARNIGLHRSVPSIVQTLLDGRERLIDVGLSTADGPKLFVNFAETGLGAAVVAREADYSHTWPGRLSFLAAAIVAALAEPNACARIAVDGEQVYDGPLVSAVVANGPYFGGGMKIAPPASMDDHLLDVLILGDFSRAELVSQIWKIYPGIHLRHPKVLWLQGREVLIEPGSTMQLDLDGELSGRGPFHFEVLPRALRVLV